MLLRLALVSHPDFYYPDLLTHTRVVEAIRAEGPSFFLHPADALSAQKAWTKPVLGSVSALPYAVMFHTPFAVLAGRLRPLDRRDRDRAQGGVEPGLRAADPARRRAGRAVRLCRPWPRSLLLRDSHLHLASELRPASGPVRATSST